MAMSVSNKLSERNIPFSKNSMITLENISINSGGTYNTHVSDLNKKYQYLKLLCNVSVNNTELTTDAYHSVVVVYNITYLDDNGNSKLITEHFFPKYQHEVNNKDTYSIIELPYNTIQSIKISVYNNEEDTDNILVEKLSILYSSILDEDTVQDMINSGGNPDIPVAKMLTVYNIDNKYTLDGVNDSLILYVTIPDELIEQYMYKANNYNSDRQIDLYIDHSGFDVKAYSISLETTNKMIEDKDNPRSYFRLYIPNSKITIKPLYDNRAKDGKLTITARLANNTEIYGQCEILFTNCEPKDFSIKSISSSDGCLHLNEDTEINFDVIPAQSSQYIKGRFTLKSYDNKGKAKNVYGSDDYSKINDSLEKTFTLRGLEKGKVSLYLGDDNIHHQYIFDVVD